MSLQLRSPQLTDLKFDNQAYSLYIGLWMQLAKPLRERYHISFMEMRILCAIDGLTKLYGWRLNGIGISESQVIKLTGFSRVGIKNRLRKLEEMNYLTHTEEGVKLVIRRYKITKRGKEIVNDLSADRDQVHERIIDFLYQKKLLKH